ncbi:MAG TPA: ribbon-helix-helix domain-containing protein [Phycisphaerae bacterium]|nr:ribbon-helix-helix domain-containing protein [Phycisphaerae bacterium]
MVTVTVKLPADIAAKIEAEARARHLPKSALIRDSLQQRYAPTRNTSRKKQPAPTIFDRTRHLAGSVRRAPRDLSSNKKHLEGFGA